jgi:hypothetical protein|mmetsp:Transcript_22207/g.37699  ORF Transcript_22207/g.37699 Transcript_22207/m.37699 type:complete len:86 (-) Transcript_22207:602-859(-)
MQQSGDQKQSFEKGNKHTGLNDVTVNERHRGMLSKGQEGEGGASTLFAKAVTGGCKSGSWAKAGGYEWVAVGGRHTRLGPIELSA